MKENCAICNQLFNRINMFHEDSLAFDSSCFNYLNEYCLDNERVSIWDAVDVLKRNLIRYGRVYGY